MIDALFSQPNYVASKKLLDATALRHEAIAGNLANLETPNYKRVDLASSFQTELQRAVASGDTSLIASSKPVLQTDTNAQAVRADGNTVQLETELAELQKNTLEYTVGTQFVTGAMTKLRLAITGRPS
jgi:flagellar basal-body rod protein FlgB